MIRFPSAVVVLPVLMLATARPALEARGLATGASQPATIGVEPSAKIVRLDSALDAVVPPGATVEKVFEGEDAIGTPEGPVWTRSGVLLFSSLAANAIYQLTSPGKVSLFKSHGPAGSDPKGANLTSNGLTFDRQGRLIICERGNRRLTRLEPNGQITVLASTYQGTRITRPNDVVVKSDGSIYFSDMCLDCEPDLGFQAVFRIVDGKLDVAAKVAAPNGLAFSPDERFLYVANSASQHWMRFEVRTDGSLGAGTVFFDAGTGPGVPDGLKVDSLGNIYATGPGGIWVLSPQAKALGRIELPGRTVQNVAWGDDGKTLYITARSIYRIRLNVGGKRPCCD